MKSLRKIAASIGLIFVVFTPLLFSTPASADTASGLNVEVYTYDSSATPDRQAYTLCPNSWTHVDNIDFDFDNQYQGIVGGCQGDFVLMHFTGTMVFPTSGSYAFLALADDGFWMSLDGQVVINDWYLKGRSGQIYTDVSIEANHPYAVDVWYYEYGGGANLTLMYAPDNLAANTWAVADPFMFTSDVAVVTPPVVDPPVVVPPVVDPPVVVPPVVDPPVVIPPVPPVVPPVPPVPPVVPVTPDPPVVPPVDPPVVTPPAPKPPVPPVVPTPVDPPTIDPPKQPEPSPQPPITQVDPATIDPTTLTPKDVVALQAAANTVLATASENSSEYQQALEQLAVAAKADDIQVDPALANTPVVGAAVVGVVNAINAIGNIGADMSPAHRATAKKEVVAAVIVTQVATTAAGIATQAAASAAAGAAGSVSSRKRN